MSKSVGRWINTGYSMCPVCKKDITTWLMRNNEVMGEYGMHNGYLYTDNNALLRECINMERNKTFKGRSL